MSGETSDEDLLTQIAAGDRSAADLFVRRHAQAVARVARAVAGSAHADDVVQEAFIRALRGASTFDPARGRARTWLFAVTRHVAYESSHASRSKEHERDDVAALDGAGSLMHLGLAAGWGATDPEQALAAAEQREHLARALASLDAHDREVLVLRDVEGLSGDDVSAVLGLDLSAMKSRLHRARLRLVAAMRAQTEGLVAAEKEAGGMRCREVLGVLSDYVDDELDLVHRVRVEHHLRECEVCARFGGRFGALVGSLREKLGAAPVVDEALVATLRDRLR